MYKRYSQVDILKVLKNELNLVYANNVPSNLNVIENSCSIPSCGREVTAKGLCNAHYIRAKKGVDLTSPLKPRDKTTPCKVCGAPRGGKGGLGFCQKHYKSFKYQSTKDAMIKALGGVCQKCNGNFHRSVYDFHHLENKDTNPSNLTTNASFEEIAKELSKCVLLCANCHRIEHATAKELQNGI